MDRRGTRRFQRLLAIVLKNALTEVPISKAQMRIETDIRPAIRAYSIAVAPEQSVRSAIRAERIRSIITAIPGGILSLLANKTALGSSENRCRNAAGLGNDHGLERSSVPVRSLEMLAFFPTTSTHFAQSGVKRRLSRPA
jgi:hypothetical protein